MAELIYQCSAPLQSADGIAYVVQTWGERDRDGWHGWLVFIAADGAILRTARESTHGSRDAVAAWAVGRRPAQLRAALARAVPPSAQLPAA